MKIERWSKNKTKKIQQSGTFIEVSRDEALQLIASLSKQLLENNPNVGRAEFLIGKGRDEYFSIGVIPGQTGNHCVYETGWR
jgi:hypothetical protein